MQQNHTSTIRGLNIAVIVLAALSLIASAIVFSVLANSKDLIYDYVASEGYSLYDDYGYDYDFDYDDLWDDDYGHHGNRYHASLGSTHPLAAAHAIPASSYYYGYEPDAMLALDLFFGIINGLLIWEMIASVAMLIFGILALVRAGKPEKLRQIMVFGILGAVISFLAGHIILTVLFIISAVMANKDKNALAPAPVPPVPPTPPTPPVPPQGTYPF